ncbi:MAG: DUF5063 domain-containing protein [Bacteroidales bacterium]|nr:DUF5063 domain-containing protein [Bacteroidales bacterium]
MSEIPESPVTSKNVFELLTVANDYCIAMRNAETTSKAKLIDYLRKVCPLLYIKASLLPETEVSNPDANERFVTEEDWEILFNTLRNKFGKQDEFWYVDNADNTNDMIKGSLAEHFTDIYQDLQDFISLYQKNTIAAKENAISEVNRLFKSRWGFRLVNAHKTLHYLSETKEEIDLATPENPLF